MTDPKESWKKLEEREGEELMESTKVKIKDVQVGGGRRELRGVEELAQSIDMLGLLNPITVTPELRLVAGLHRLRACQSLGWTDIPAVIVRLDSLMAELAEIDENLVRNDLTELERAEQMARRQHVYETIHPETRSTTVRGGPGRGKKKTSDKLSSVSSFADDTAKKTGINKRTVQRDTQIAKSIPQDVRDSSAWGMQ